MVMQKEEDMAKKFWISMLLLSVFTLIAVGCTGGTGQASVSDDGVVAQQVDDGHTDEAVEVAHADDGHADEAVEVAHADDGHADEAVEVAHADDGHADEAVEVAHADDGHADEAVEVAHADDGHADEAVEVAHADDGHADEAVEVAHADDGHADEAVGVAHVDDGHAHEASNLIEDAREITIIATEFEFQPWEIHVQKGEAITIVLINEGLIEHDMAIPELGFHAHAEPGETVKASFVVGESGEYSFECTLPGHKLVGMVGGLHVEEVLVRITD